MPEPAYEPNAQPAALAEQPVFAEEAPAPSFEPAILQAAAAPQAEPVAPVYQPTPIREPAVASYEAPGQQEPMVASVERQPEPVAAAPPAPTAAAPESLDDRLAQLMKRMEETEEMMRGLRKAG